MLLVELVEVSNAVSATRARSKKIELLAGFLGRLSSEEASSAVSYLAGKPRQDRLNAGYATVFGVEVEPAEEPTLEILDVDSSLGQVAAVGGPGSKAERERILADLMAKATVAEQEFLRGMILRNLRQGALEGVMADAVAVALDVPAERVRRAAMLSGDLVAVASAALAEGPETLDEARLEVFTAIQPMLAKTATSAGDAVAQLGTAVVEWKLDGARLQVHRSGDDVTVYTRNLRDITAGVPEVVDSVRDFDVDSVILDGEILLFGHDGMPELFQDSMSRFGSEGEEGARPLTSFYFDCLHLNGRDLIDEPLSVRRAALDSALPDTARVGAIVTADPGEANSFFDEAVAAGYEGVVVKDPDLPYAAGRRGAGWLKVKPTYTLDLVILAAEWGSGRRQGWLSNLHLGARDGDEYVMLGKTFKGLTDEMLAWQTEAFLDIERSRDGHVVYLEPSIVYEVAFDGVQRSTRYPGGVALRFARVKRHREDKNAVDADTIDTVRSHLR